jgi:hypothetical protein
MAIDMKNFPKKVKKNKRFNMQKFLLKEYEMNIDLSQFNNVDLGEEKYTSTL